jgi:hypothetical protein
MFSLQPTTQVSLPEISMVQAVDRANLKLLLDPDDASQKIPVRA